MQRNYEEFFKGMLIGSFFGTVATIFLAPKSGKETRDEIKQRTDQLIKKSQEEYENTLSRVQKTYESAANKLKSLENSIKKSVEDVETSAKKLSEKGKEKVSSKTKKVEKAEEKEA